MSAAMGRYARQKRLMDIRVLPDDLMHIIFAKLDFRGKINAGIVCKLWDELLRTNTPAARQWVIDYNVDEIVLRSACMAKLGDAFSQQPSLVIVRCAAVLTRSLGRFVSPG
jgi:hypothetical protein